ncbi:MULTISPECIES: outer membrane beta-barrel protein [Thiomicrorhabdus]|uniref:Outer membrane beta-barrel protein n=1 Tax=Thiomicrorhabdus heinhorstiae TaxID=2748010 RepID=A0ABS0BV95_9GAMM|nr:MULTISPECIES: outer membrane beta-barrel protein [Thiomicrorhabdus]MBF6056879.1 outer membrane beta-barrel protein [Thiomicrorhabdus heinhorstiae]
MKKLALTSLASTALLVASFSAQAGTFPSTYFDVTYNHFEWEPKGVDSFATPAAGIALGFRGNPFFGLQFAAGTGTDEGSPSNLFPAASFRIDEYYSAYLVGTFADFERFSINGKIGYSKIYATKKYTGTSLKDKTAEESMSWGFDGKLKFTKNFALVVSYTNLYDKDDVQISGVGGGVEFVF